MAKEKEAKGDYSLDSLRKDIKPIVPHGDVMSASTYSKITEWIGTGNYHLNALIGGSLFKGIPNNRSVGLVGESGVGKTYFLLNLCREAQRMGYHIIYFDSEGAIDAETAQSFGVDPKKMDLLPVSQLGQFKNAVTTICKKLMEAKNAGKSVPKVMICLDSMGMLASEKEVNDALEGNTVADFTRAKTIRAIFRIITSDMTGLGIPFVYTNHTYASIGPYPTVNVSGGGGQVYSPSVMLNLTKAKLKDGADEKVQTGIVVTAKPLKNRLAKPGETKLHIHFSKGMNAFIGLQDYVVGGQGWANCGIERGNIVAKKDYEKLKPEEQEKCSPFKMPDGAEAWFSPKATAQKFVVRHLGETVTAVELFTDRVFSRAVLEELDERCIKPRFKYGVDEESAEIEAFLNEEA
jgi:RecA/RadA recombinase